MSVIFYSHIDGLLNISMRVREPWNAAAHFYIFCPDRNYFYIYSTTCLRIIPSYNAPCHRRGKPLVWVTVLYTAVTIPPADPLPPPVVTPSCHTKPRKMVARASYHRHLLPTHVTLALLMTNPFIEGD